MTTKPAHDKCTHPRTTAARAACRKAQNPQGVTFHITNPRVWQGNGFGDAPAHWVAMIGDVEVGRYEGYWAEVFGNRTVWGDSGIPRWKAAVIRAAEKGI